MRNSSSVYDDCMCVCVCVCSQFKRVCMLCVGEQMKEGFVELAVEMFSDNSNSLFPSVALAS